MGITNSFAGGHRRKLDHKIEVVIAGNAVKSLRPAFFAAVDEDMLASASSKNSNRGHQSPATRGAISRGIAVNVLGVKAMGAVITIAAAGSDRINHLPAVFTIKPFIPRLHFHAFSLSATSLPALPRKERRGNLGFLLMLSMVFAAKSEK
jgi:hypothetical protein